MIEEMGVSGTLGKEPMNLTWFTFQGREVKMNRGVALSDNCSWGVYLKGGDWEKVKETLTSPVPQQIKIVLIL